MAIPGPSFSTNRKRTTDYGPSILMEIRDEASLVSMKLDPKFVIEYAQEGVATLTTDLGDSVVSITRRRFVEGWKEFAEIHRLNVNSVLKFEHTGNLSFRVRIFDGPSGELIRFI